MPLTVPDRLSKHLARRVNFGVACSLFPSPGSANARTRPAKTHRGTLKRFDPIPVWVPNHQALDEVSPTRRATCASRFIAPVPPT